MCILCKFKISIKSIDARNIFNTGKYKYNLHCFNYHYNKMNAINNRFRITHACEMIDFFF